MQPCDGGWPSRKGAAAADAMDTRAYFPMLSLPSSIMGLAVTSKGILCSLTDCLRNMLIAWVVLMPSSEKSFAASSLVCLSMRTVTLTVSMRTSLPYEFVAWNCTCGRRDFLGIRHDMTEIRHVATGIRLDPLPYTKIAPMMQCAMGAI